MSIEKQYKAFLLFLVMQLSLLFPRIISKASDYNFPDRTLGLGMPFNPDTSFKCLNYSDIIIPLSYVNDNYCDCLDGSDELNTSACSDAIFHCANHGLVPKDIPSSRVDDGICDCCDGSDEQFSSKISCTNTCIKKDKPASYKFVSKKGLHGKAQLVKSGTQKVNRILKEIGTLINKRHEAEKLKAEKEKIFEEWKEKRTQVINVYREIKRQEIKLEEQLLKYRNDAINYFMSFDANNDGFITLAEVKNTKLFDQNNDGVVTESEARFYFDGRESVNLEIFLSITWQLLKPFQFDYNELDKILDPSIVNEDISLQFGNHNDDVELDVHNKYYVVKSKKNQDQIYQDSLQVVKNANEADTELFLVKKDMSDIDSELDRAQHFLNRDYGEHNEFFDLYNKLFYYEDDEHEYKFGFYNSILQISKKYKKRRPIILGYFDKWSGEKGKLYSEMRYINGTESLHRPYRVATVKLQCGDENKIVSVTEPYICTYEIDFATPAACEYLIEHDEL